MNYHYNFLNLLDKAEGSGGREVSYSWVYPGEKRGVKDETGKGYGYWGNFLYSLNGSSLNLSSAFFDGGEFVCGMNTHAVYYRLSDHLGSVRAVMDSTGIVRERNDYYPLGMRHLCSEYPLFAGNRFKYNGKEEQTMGGLGFLDYGARMYDAGLGRWFVSDPLAEGRYWLSLYQYCQNNPIIRVDPNGTLDDNYMIDRYGYISFTEKTDDQFDVIYTMESWKNDKKDEFTKVAKGILNYKITTTRKAKNGKEYTFDLYSIKGDYESKKLFEFIVNNTEVEWSQTLIGVEKEQKSILSTSHVKNAEAGQSYLFINNYTIRGHNHSHPYNKKPSFSDKNWAKNVHLKFPKAKLQILFKGEYFEYNKNGLIPSIIQ